MNGDGDGENARKGRNLQGRKTLLGRFFAEKLASGNLD